MEGTLMKTNRAFWIAFVAVIGAAPLAMAKAPATVGDDASVGHTYVQPLPSQRVLADNVVVSPTPAPAPQPAPVVVAPGEPAATQPAVIEEPRRREIITTQSEPHNYMGTIAVSALMGGVTGVLIGGAIYYLGSQNHPYNIAYWAAGGVLVGTGVGLTQVVVQESRASQAVATFEDPAPTYRLALYHTTF
jgi:hypothetical protein